MIKEPKIYSYAPIVYVTLSIYSWSLLQFTFNLVTARGRSPLARHTSSLLSMNESENERNIRIFKLQMALHTELINVVITLIMQDMPFFFLRIYCVLKFQIVSYLFLFFLFKNGIIFLLQIYRIAIILVDKDFRFHVQFKGPVQPV